MVPNESFAAAAAAAPMEAAAGAAAPLETTSDAFAAASLREPATASLVLEDFLAALASKQPTPGGGAAAAVAAAVGMAAATMSAAYTQRKKDVESGAAELATAIAKALNVPVMLEVADADGHAYANLQRSWKEPAMPAAERAEIEQEALNVPTDLIGICHNYVQMIETFLPHCNPNITSDAKVGIHLLAGAARAAFQTAAVNKPSAEVKAKLLWQVAARPRAGSRDCLAARPWPPPRAPAPAAETP